MGERGKIEIERLLPPIVGLGPGRHLEVHVTLHAVRLPSDFKLLSSFLPMATASRSTILTA